MPLGLIFLHPFFFELLKLCKILLIMIKKFVAMTNPLKKETRPGKFLALFKLVVRAYHYKNW